MDMNMQNQSPAGIPAGKGMGRMYALVALVLFAVAGALAWWFFRPTQLAAPAGGQDIQDDLNQIKVDDIDKEFNDIDKDLQSL